MADVKPDMSEPINIKIKSGTYNNLSSSFEYTSASYREKANVLDSTLILPCLTGVHCVQPMERRLFLR